MINEIFISTKRQKHQFTRSGMILFCIILIAGCSPKKVEKQSPLKFIYAIDTYRAHVADSLKYLIPILDSILESDQKFRYGTGNNPEGKWQQQKAIERFKSHISEVRHIDSINLIKISAIIDKYGWLGYKTIGVLESNAIFFVVQHADSVTWEKYLPLLRKVVLDKKENAHHLAMMEDRLSLKKYSYQLYGTQVIYDFQKKKYYLMPVFDPENIIQRRKLIGLDSATFQSYLNTFHIQWNIETYKSELPEVEQLMAHRK
jgi:hypothetical protein